MTAAIWKIPRRWEAPSLCDRTALYPALYLRWAGIPVVICREALPGQWNRARLRVLVTDGPLAEDERALMMRTVARGAAMLHVPQGGVSAADQHFLADLGVPMLAWGDAGPLASARPALLGCRLYTVSGCAARLAEDMLIARELSSVGPSPAVRPATGGRYFVVAADSVGVFRDIQPALAKAAAADGASIIVTSDAPAVLSEVAGLAQAIPVGSADPALPSLIAGARAFLCAVQGSPSDSPKPGQWVRSALNLGAPVVAASHPSIDGLAHLCVLDDWERGLSLYTRFAVERLKAIVTAQSFLYERLRPARIAAEWAALEQDHATPSPQRHRIGERFGPRLLLVLIDMQQDLDVLLPVLIALHGRDEVRLRIAVTDWLVTESPRVLNVLAAHGLPWEILPRDAVRRGDAPALTGVDGVLTGSDTSVRAHKSGHRLATRARARGARTFTMQHGFENVGLTYKDDLYGEEVRFASETIFTWCPRGGLAPWVAAETRAAVKPVGSPKTPPPPADALPLNQGYWPRTVGVFESLHWERFGDAYRESVLADLHQAAIAYPDTLFLIKPHHAGRWASRNRSRIRESANLVVIDPTDSVWEPHTAPALIAGADAILTTPSTVALDAARAGRPTAVFGYDLDLPLYRPLPIVRSMLDLAGFLDDGSDDFLLRNEAFLKRSRLPGRADHRIAAAIAEALRTGARTHARARPRLGLRA